MPRTVHIAQERLQQYTLPIKDSKPTSQTPQPLSEASGSSGSTVRTIRAQRKVESDVRAGNASLTLHSNILFPQIAKSWNHHESIMEGITLPDGFVDRSHAFAQKFGVPFKRDTFLMQALLHPSYFTSNKHGDLRLSKRITNESLSLLGSSLYQFFCTAYVYQSQSLSSFSDLDRLRSELMAIDLLYRLGQEYFALHELLLVDEAILKEGEGHIGDLYTHGRKQAIASSVHALLAAVYLDQGLTVCSMFATNHIFPRVAEWIPAMGNSIAELQKLSYERFKVQPIYREVSRITKADGEQEFTFAVYLGSKCVGQAKASSLKVARKLAAANALERVKSSVGSDDIMGLSV